MSLFLEKYFLIVFKIVIPYFFSRGDVGIISHFSERLVPVV